MATNNYCGFSYGSAQYGAAATPAAGYPGAQAGYAIAPPTAAAYGAQRPAGYDQAYQTAAAAQGAYPVAAAAAGAYATGYDYSRALQYDSSKTYYQQAASYSAPPTTTTKTHYSAPPVRNNPPTPVSKTATPANASIANAKDKSAAAGNKMQASVPTTSYSNYDAALYSAATMFVAQQHGKMVNPAGGAVANMNAGSWQQYNKKSGQSSTGHKMRSKPQPRPQQLHYCEVCKISCAGPQTYREHLEGQKHKKREASLKMQASAQTTTQNRGNSYHCELCDVTCTGNDAYAAHVRGSKHQKVVKLHQKLGKPIPSDDPKKLSKVSFVAIGNAGAAGSETKETTGGGNAEGEENSQADNEQDVQMSNAATSNIKPVGVEYIEEMKDDEGKIVSFNCKLCDCKFNDPNAKEMHMKGRRHRLQYKRKVQPDLVVDTKQSPRQRRLAEARDQRKLMQNEYNNSRRGNYGNEDESSYWDERRRFDDEYYYSSWMQRGFQGSPRGGPFMGGRSVNVPPGGHPFFGMLPGRRPESTDDRHAIARHAEIYPKEEELQTIQRIVSHTERALKFVSDTFAEKQENGNVEKPDTNKAGNIKDGRDNQMFSFQKETENNNARLLKGVMRVGCLAKGLLLQGDNLVELVVLCSEKPTVGLLKKVSAELPIKLKEVANDNSTEYRVLMSVDDAAVLVSDDAVTVKISLTSALLRETESKVKSNTTTANNNSTTSTNDMIVDSNADDSALLPKEPCLQALAELRHAKWFLARATGLQSCVMVIRILRDLCQRVPSWQALNQWSLELMIEKVISSAGYPFSPGDCLRRIMEALSTGFLINGPGILDPCEKEPHDALVGLSKQQREDLTVSAQMFLRYIAFRQIYKVLGMDQLPAPKFPSRPWRLNRKRRRSGGDNNDNEEKTDEKQPKKENSTE